MDLDTVATGATVLRAAIDDNDDEDDEVSSSRFRFMAAEDFGEPFEYLSSSKVDNVWLVSPFEIGPLSPSITGNAKTLIIYKRNARKTILMTAHFSLAHNWCFTRYIGRRTAANRLCKVFHLIMNVNIYYAKTQIE